MITMTKRAAISLATKAGWTALQAAFGVLITSSQIQHLSTSAYYGVLIAAGLSAVKSFLASKVGNPDTTRFDATTYQADLHKIAVGQAKAGALAVAKHENTVEGEAAEVITVDGDQEIGGL